MRADEDRPRLIALRARSRTIHGADCELAREAIRARLVRPPIGVVTGGLSPRPADVVTGFVIGRRFWCRPLAKGSGPPRNLFSPSLRGKIRPTRTQGCVVIVSIAPTAASLLPLLFALTAIVLLAAYIASGILVYLLATAGYGIAFLFSLGLFALHRDLATHENVILREWVRALEADIGGTAMDTERNK